MSDTDNTNSNVVFLGLLTILFICLKLCEVIDWPWYWVLSTIWLPIAFVFGLFVFLLVVILVIASVMMIFSGLLAAFMKAFVNVASRCDVCGEPIKNGNCGKCHESYLNARVTEVTRNV